jgi:hypothetical protein
MLIAGFFMGTTQMSRHGGCWLARACGSLYTWRKATWMFFQSELCRWMGGRYSGASPLSFFSWLFIPPNTFVVILLSDSCKMTGKHFRALSSSCRLDELQSLRSYNLIYGVLVYLMYDLQMNECHLSSVTTKISRYKLRQVSYVQENELRFWNIATLVLGELRLQEISYVCKKSATSLFN